MIVRHKDGIGAFGGGEQLSRGGLGGAVVEIAIGAGVKGLASGGEAGAKARLAIDLGRGTGETGDIGDALVAERTEIVGEGLAAGEVVRGDRGQVLVLMRAVEQDHGDAGGGTAGGQFGRHRDRCHDDAIDLIIHDLADDLIDVHAGLRGEEDQDVVADLLQFGRQAFDHLGVEVVFKVGHHQPDDAAFAGFERAGQHVGPIAKLGCGGAHLLGRLDADRGAGREDPADGGLADAGESRNLQRCDFLSGQLQSPPEVGSGAHTIG